MDRSVVGATIGFDAITVALWSPLPPPGDRAGRPALQGAARRGRTAMRAARKLTSKIVLVLQSTIVLFIAAPPLIRAIFRLPERRPPSAAPPRPPPQCPAAAPAAPHEGGLSHGLGRFCRLSRATAPDASAPATAAPWI